MYIHIFKKSGEINPDKNPYLIVLEAIETKMESQKTDILGVRTLVETTKSCFARVADLHLDMTNILRRFFYFYTRIEFKVTFNSKQDLTEDGASIGKEDFPIINQTEKREKMDRVLAKLKETKDKLAKMSIPPEFDEEVKKFNRRLEIILWKAKSNERLIMEALVNLLKIKEIFDQLDVDITDQITAIKQEKWKVDNQIAVLEIMEAAFPQKPQK